MIGIKDGKGNDPVSTENLEAGVQAVGDRAKFRSLLDSSGLLGMAGLTVALDNLRK